MEYTLAFVFRNNSPSDYYEDDNLLGVLVVDGHIDGRTALEQGVLDEVIDSLDLGTAIKIELYNLLYDNNADIIDVKEKIKEDLQHLLFTKAIKIVQTYELEVTVSPY